MKKEFKNVDDDPTRMAEYRERQRMSLVVEEYYKLKTEYKTMDDKTLLVLAHETIVSKEKEIDSK